MCDHPECLSGRGHAIALGPLPPRDAMRNIRVPAASTESRVGPLSELSSYLTAEANNLEGLLQAAEDRYSRLTGKPMDEPLRNGGETPSPVPAPLIETRYDEESPIGLAWNQANRLNRLQRRLAYVLDCIGAAL